MLTLSIIKADTGGFIGHSGMDPDMLDVARRAVEGVVGAGGARASGLWFEGRPAAGLRPWADLDRADAGALRPIAQALGPELDAFLAAAPALDADQARARESLEMLAVADG